MRAILVLSLLFFPFALLGETPKLPPEKELKALTLNTLLAFNKAVQEKSFAGFYKDQTSSILREQVSADKFSAAMQEFIEKKFDIAGISKVEAVFEEKPTVDGNGVVTLKGNYPAEPNTVRFRLRYLYEKSAWKLLFIDVGATPVAVKVPGDKELKALVRASLLEFNKALQEENFDDFYSEISTVWQEQTTAEKLQEAFQTIIDQKINVGAIVQKLPLSFAGQPAVNSDGVLVVKGSYPTKPSKFSFLLKYIHQETDWKLIGFNIDIDKDPDAASKTDDDDKADN